MASEWLNGFYKRVMDNEVHGACIVDGQQAISYGKSFGDEKGTMVWAIGDFGEAEKAVQELTGQKRYNIKITSSMLKDILGVEDAFGVISDDGKTVTSWFLAKACQYIWITEEEANEMRNNTDPVDFPTCHYKVQPENLGKFIWVSGPPGHGKSTTCKTLMETKGFVYYEGDCFVFNVNPFIPPFDGDPIDEIFKQKELKGISKERSHFTSKAFNAYNELAMGDKHDAKNIDILKQMYTLMSEDIDKQRKRIGGDWAVCQAVPKREHRDLIRSKLGPDLVFVVLEMDKELGLERLRGRKDFHEDMIQLWAKMGEIFEPATENEENAIALKVTPDMSPVDVEEKILNDDLLKTVINKLC